MPRPRITRSVRHFGRLGLLALLLGLLPACGRMGPSVKPLPPTPNPFPAPEEIARITRQPPPAPPAGTAPAAVDQWTLTGPFPAEPEGPPPADAIGGAAVVEAAGQRQMKATAAMHCVARELGRFVATHDGAPSVDLQSFITGRCGAPTASPSYRWYIGEAGPEEAPAEILARWGEGPQKIVGDLLGKMKPGAAVGCAMVRVDETAVWLIAADDPGTRLEGYTGLPDADGRIVVRGVSGQGYPIMEAVVTRGRFGYAACDAEALEAERFAFVCPIERGDARARIEVLGVPEGAVLGDQIVAVDAWPGGAPGDTWSPPPGVERRPVDDIAAVGEAFTASLNTLRGEAGLDPLTVAPTQSQMLVALAPHYWSAVTGAAERQLADQVALGSMAGYGVEGVVERGLFAATRRWGAPDAGLLLRDMLASPARRRALFMPGLRVIAPAPTRFGEQFTGIMVGTYKTFDEATFDAAAAGRAVRTRLDARRAAKGLPELVAWPGMQELMDEVAATIGREKLAPHEALERALSVASNSVYFAVRGVVVEATSLDGVPLPAALEGNAPLPVAVAAGYTRAGPHPWVRRVVLIIWPTVITEPSGETASGPGLAGGGPAPIGAVGL